MLQPMKEIKKKLALQETEKKKNLIPFGTQA